MTKPIQSIEALFFDFDGVLVDSTRTKSEMHLQIIMLPWKPAFILLVSKAMSIFLIPWCPCLIARGLKAL